MYSEFALTPQVFDPKAHPDQGEWSDCIMELASAMFPRSAPPAVLISDLYDGSWFGVVKQQVDTMENVRGKVKCQSLLTKIKDYTVFRPAARPEDWPEEEIQWAREAYDSMQLEPLHRLVMTEDCRDALGESHDSIRTPRQSLNTGFWDGVDATRSVPRIIQRQVALLRSLAVNAEFLCVITPYCASEQELPFITALISSAFNRPKNYRDPVVEIHCCAFDADKDAGEQQNQVDRFFRDNFVRNIQPALTGEQQVGVKFWPKGHFKERYLLAGKMTTLQNEPHPAPHWGVNFSHLARPGDSSEETANFSIMRDKDITCEFKRFCQSKHPHWPIRRTISAT